MTIHFGFGNVGRRPRIHFAGAFYHVIARGNQGQKVFREDGDYQLYLKFLKEYKERFRFYLYGYALMPTHVLLPVRKCFVLDGMKVPIVGRIVNTHMDILRVLP
ncbi:MAG: hypothetical protein FJ117_17170 [Deltaproteobacteria bacterium]|nr:hypothetical protein [Deltaproteobacteria bacterium]